MKILVIMPTYNQSDRIDYAIESILNQTYKDWHLVIVNDGSTDDTAKKLEKYEEHPQITIKHNYENAGCYYSRNVGLKTAVDMGYEFNVFTVHDSDDVSSPDRFAKCIKPFEDKRIWVLTTRYGRTYDQLEKFDTECSIERNSMGLGIGFYKRSIFDRIGYYDDTRFGGDSEYFERAEKCCKSANNKHIGNFDSEMLYIAVYCDDNLTKTVNMNERELYTNKYRLIHSNMNSIYKPFGEQFKHIIVCRFNIPMGHGDKSNDVKYTRHRLDIMKKFLIPSLESQVNKNFDFYLFCQLGDDIRDIMESELKDTCVNIYEWTSHEEFNEFVKEEYKNYNYIMTSRIDSDDFYSSVFVGQVQSYFKNKPQVIDCRGYLQYDLNKETFAEINKYQFSSPFCTIVVPTKDYKGIMLRKHTDWINLAGDHYDDINFPVATQLIHNTNLLNRLNIRRYIKNPPTYDFI